MQSLKKRQRVAGRENRALLPYRKRALPQLYLSGPNEASSAVFHPEPGESGPRARIKWLASTCLAGVVGVCVIGISIYGSMDVEDGTGVVSSIKHASLAAMKPMRRAPAVQKGQSVAGQKSDRIQTASLGLASKHIIHDSVVQRRGEREYIRIKPYARLVSRLATVQPEDPQDIPPFNPFKLYADPKPLAENSEDSGAEANPEVTVNKHELDGGILPVEDDLSLDTRKISQLIAELDGVFADPPFAMRPAIHPEDAGGLVQKAAYKPDQLMPSDPLEQEAPANTTVIGKTVNREVPEDEVAQGQEIKTVTVKRGDTLMGLLVNAGAERWQAKAITDAMAPEFSAKSLQEGQEIRFTLMPAPRHDGQMEPVKVSLFTGETHEVTVGRNDAGEYVASDDPIDLKAIRKANSSQTKRATLYTSFYHAALKQDIPSDVIMKLLRIHSYDVDFKQRAGVGDSFEVFYGLEAENGQEKTPGEILFTAMRIDGEKQRYYRFRTPDGTVDYYDREGNSAKKFLMRKPVKGARFTSGFGMRHHPILGGRRMHTGADWAAPRGTPILAAGSGIVEEAERKGGNGNYIRIRHANGYQTSYSHLSRFAKGLKPGIRVNQGQVIGYVGSTGLSSGPHLHFEVLVNNRQVDPMTIHVPRGRQLTGKLLARFQQERNRIDELMRRAPVTTRMAAVQNQAR